MGVMREMWILILILILNVLMCFKRFNISLINCFWRIAVHAVLTLTWILLAMFCYTFDFALLSGGNWGICSWCQLAREWGSVEWQRRRGGWWMWTTAGNGWRGWGDWPLQWGDIWLGYYYIIKSVSLLELDIMHKLWLDWNPIYDLFQIEAKCLKLEFSHVFLFLGWVEMKIC